jgi:hypothetical protein
MSRKNSTHPPTLRLDQFDDLQLLWTTRTSFRCQRTPVRMVGVHALYQSAVMISVLAASAHSFSSSAPIMLLPSSLIALPMVVRTKLKQAGGYYAIYGLQHVLLMSGATAVSHLRRNYTLDTRLPFRVNILSRHLHCHNDGGYSN